ncbi:thiol reductant ABC exporter subunit CydC [Priestia taiwanensis]|uniref:Amino acid ABC transporter ATP-binding protein n=1 Tax=Priestia taiwanensis TaxID=1347902 RepID=A0A917AT08_9BACI|nr:thiol reductant ABC exporter subunit CydC [Priestia taiwanensis]MBM7365219.1 ATP-binding cassette subfamily C protein CydC [Priestia taiwanensis]GGE73600.1 amino acid ABC transporter ATP-binding protein [Priestia taiwanensis]
MNGREWVQPHLKQQKKLMLVTVLLGLIGVTCAAMLMFMSGYLISKSALQPYNVMAVYVPIVATRAFSIGSAVFLYLERLVGHDVVLRILANMRTKLYRVLEPQALFIRSRFQSGDILGLLSEDIEHLQNLYLRTIFPSILAVFVYSGFIITIGAFDVPFALMMALLLGVIVFLIPFVSLLIIQKQHIQLRQKRNTLYQKLTDTVFGLTDWQASGRTTEFLTNFMKDEEDLVTMERRIKRWHHIRDAFIHLVVGITMVSMIIWTGEQADVGNITITVIAAFVLMTLSITASLAPVSDAIERIPSYKDSIVRLTSVEVEKEMISVQDDEQKKEVAGSATIHFDSVSYRYSEASKWTINDVSLTIPIGKKVAILGKSGVGKSTLLKLLTGAVQPVKGEILLNDEQAHLDNLSTYLSVLNQKPHLFDMTVGDNIRLGREDAEDEAVWRALDQAQITSLIESLPEGLDTPMHEMGKRFSGGERQRIAFARVLLQDTPIIVLDEPTIGLDPKTEHELLHTMFQAAEDKTIIWVTHHLAGIEQMDEIIFLENGRIAMQGSHEELLRTNKKYRQLYEMDKGI